MPLALMGLARSERERRTAELIAAADREDEPLLTAAADRFPSQVSGGERQRMAVLRAIAHDPRVVLADEPMSNLDAASVRRVVALLRRWLAGELAHPSSVPRVDRTLILCTHNAAIAWALADRFLLLRPSETGEHRLLDRARWAVTAGW